MSQDQRDIVYVYLEACIGAGESGDTDKFLIYLDLAYQKFENMKDREDLAFKYEAQAILREIVSNAEKCLGGTHV